MILSFKFDTAPSNGPPLVSFVNASGQTWDMTAGAWATNPTNYTAPSIGYGVPAFAVLFTVNVPKIPVVVNPGDVCVVLLDPKTLVPYSSAKPLPAPPTGTVPANFMISTVIQGL